MKSFLNFGECVISLVSKAEEEPGCRVWKCHCGGDIHHSPVVGEDLLDGNTLGICDQCEVLFIIQEYAGQLAHIQACPSSRRDVPGIDLQDLVSDLVCPECEKSVRVTHLAVEHKDSDAQKECSFVSCGKMLRVD